MGIILFIVLIGTYLISFVAVLFKAYRAYELGYYKWSALLTFIAFVPLLNILATDDTF